MKNLFYRLLIYLDSANETDTNYNIAWYMAHHISEVAHGYVEDINDVLKVQDAVKVKVLSVDGSKIGLSIRQTQEKPQVEERRPERRVQSRQSAESFEAKMKSFLRDSNERVHDLKRNTEGKRGGRGGRRD